MEEKELISKIQTLKQIKPKKEWVVLAKSQIVDAPSLKAKEYVFENKAGLKGTFTGLFNSSFQRDIAYSLAIFLFAVIGTFGLSGVIFNQNIQEEPINPVILSELRNNVENFKIKSQNLSDIARYQAKDVPVAVEEVRVATKELTETIKKEPKLAKEVALEINNNKTYLNIEGADGLKETSNDLYKTIDEQMIKDLEKATLTESQEESLKIIKDLYQKADYSNALESVLLLDIAMEQSKNTKDGDDKSQHKVKESEDKIESQGSLEVEIKK